MSDLKPYRYEENPTNSGVSKGTDFLAKVLLVIGILLIIGMLVNVFTPKCGMADCDNERKEGSQYCYLHDMSDRYYGNPDYNEVYEKSQGRKGD